VLNARGDIRRHDAPFHRPLQPGEIRHAAADTPLRSSRPERSVLTVIYSNTKPRERTRGTMLSSRSTRHAAASISGGVRLAFRMDVIFGPPAPAKSTLRGASGLDAPTAGPHRLDGRALTETAGRIHLPPAIAKPRWSRSSLRSSRTWSVAANVTYGLHRLLAAAALRV